MQFVKIGDRFINLAQVAIVNYYPSHSFQGEQTMARIEIFFAVQEVTVEELGNGFAINGSKLESAKLHGSDAEQLHDYLAGRAQHL